MNYQKILELILDSNNFTVGGGSAASLAGAQGAALLAMVTRLSLNKGYQLSDGQYKKIIDELELLKGRLLNGAVDDSQAYLLIKNAYGLPKQTEEQKQLRRREIESAGYQAASVPLSNAKQCYRVLELAKQLENNYNSNAISDYQVAVSLIRVGIDGCKKNVDVNLPLIKDENKLTELRQQLSSIVIE